MKHLEPSQVEELLQILAKKPGQRIVHFSDANHILTKHLQHFCQNIDTQYYLYCINDSCYDDIKPLYADASHIKTIKFNLRRPRYLIQGIEYDYLLATLDFTQENKREFLEKCYPIIRTGGNIIILIPNSTSAQRDEWSTLLEETYYLSVNIIDNIFNDNDVIVAKRMHGWGDE
ncbi:MAG TPA: hypothetical protein ENJ34_03935 [Epsilonproteobacteria bacterium]|nr:hypothetical protein [Campylobacterota bacterium]